MANDFHSRAIKLAKYEDLRPAAYRVCKYTFLKKVRGINPVCVSVIQKKIIF